MNQHHLIYSLRLPSRVTAIGMDPNCGWTRGEADVVYVADAFQVMERLNSLLETQTPGSVSEKAC